MDNLHHQSYHQTRTVVIFYPMIIILVSLLTTPMLWQTAAEAMLSQSNEKQPTTASKQTTAAHHQHQHQHRNASSSRARSSSSTKQNRSSSSLVRLSKAPDSSSRLFETIDENFAAYLNEPPLFMTDKRNFVIDLAKSQPGKRVTIIQAYDGDGDQLRFQLKQAPFRDASQYFTINSTTGELRLSTKQQFKYRIPSSSTDSSSESVAGESEEQQRREDNDDEDKNDDGAATGTERPIALKMPNLYFLNVAVSDGRAGHDATIELKIHVTNSTLMKLRNLDDELVGGESGSSGGDLESEVENLQKIMREKSREFYEKLNHQVKSPHHLSSSSSGSNSSATATIVYPDFVNPGLNVADQQQQTMRPAASDETTLDDFAAVVVDQTSAPSQQRGPSHQVLLEPLSTSTLSPAPSSSLRIGSPSSSEHPPSVGHQSAAPEPMMMNLIMIMCSCLMIALVLLMFIIPLSVKKLRKRLKHVELQHENLSHKTSNVSSTLGSSLTSTTARHHPSLSQFTLGSDAGSGVLCTRRDSSSVFRQSSLDSAMSNTTTMSPTTFNRQHHRHNHQHSHRQQQFNRVDNGSIANPVYLHQQQQQQQHYDPRMCEFKQPSLEVGELMMIQQQQQQMFGLQGPQRVSANENVYYPLSDEFYSTIQTDTTPLGYDGVQQIRGFTESSGGGGGGGSNYLMAQCAQPDVGRRQLDSPDSSSSSSPALKSLTRLLSLPAHSKQTDACDDTNIACDSSTIRQLEQQLGCGAFSTMGPNHQTKHQQNNRQQLNAMTIARTHNVEREHGGGGRLELDRHRLRQPWVLLDEGQFGQVWRCKLSGSGIKQAERFVAVKSLKKNATNGERGREELLAEIEIMQLVCEHPNVVKLLHCCTVGDDKPILLVMEYIEEGKLQSYLEKSRKNHHYSTSPFASVDDDARAHELPREYLTSRDLMKFIYHIAKGMEYIAGKFVVHRDLASRNILVSRQKICKIGDFGMARHMQSPADVYERHSGNCKIPVRWMAPEVLLNNCFTTKSDVFSFGILMWEIITLGSTPYTHLKTEQVINRVAKQGERPERPDYCHAQLYNIMSRCWQPEAAARPTFKELVDILDELVLSANNYIELDQYPDHDYYNIPKTAAPDELL